MLTFLNAVALTIGYLVLALLSIAAGCWIYVLRWNKKQPLDEMDPPSLDYSDEYEILD